MSEKQIDLDAMRALADDALNVTAILSDRQGMPADDPRWIAYDRAVDPATIIAYIDEIEQLRALIDKWKGLVDIANRAVEAVIVKIEQLRKERDTLREALRFYADFDCTHHRGTVARAALAAQGDKPHDR